MSEPAIRRQREAPTCHGPPMVLALALAWLTSATLRTSGSCLGLAPRVAQRGALDLVTLAPKILDERRALPFAILLAAVPGRP